ncbi:MAG: hypothetical protein EZS28_001789 [Streblomastix strix]|uniref:Cyclin N-terminal domain-containing protein n=1 Tax=Streblomastix strix TaxID=222440 RepID=A0A5J4X679_9EUKA|nr:MAG: hypothetical protein EZS28_001789 [Streblomastix strix]
MGRQKTARTVIHTHNKMNSQYSDWNITPTHNQNVMMKEEIDQRTFEDQSINKDHSYQNVVNESYEIPNIVKLREQASEPADDQFIEAVTLCLLNIFETNILHQQNEQDDQRAAEELRTKILHFFQYLSQYTNSTRSELAVTIFLISKLVDKDIEYRAKGDVGIISELNLGTILLVALELATKLMRDVSYKNSWWAKALGMETATLNSSESVFLQRLHFELNMPESVFWSLYLRLSGY